VCPRFSNARKPASFSSCATIKALISQPFIIVGQYGHLEKLREWGFQTYPELFDESYDEEDDILIRIDRVVDELERLSKLSEDDLKNELQKINKIVEYNFNFFKDFLITQKKRDL